MRRQKYQSHSRVKRQPFKLNIGDLGLGDTDAELVKVQYLLNRLGYMKENYQRERLDETTRKGLLKYQSFHKLERTGRTDQRTVEKLERPRCGTADLIGPGPHFEGFEA